MCMHDMSELYSKHLYQDLVTDRTFVLSFKSSFNREDFLQPYSSLK